MRPTEEQLRVLAEAETILRALGVREVDLYADSAMATAADRAAEALTLASAVKTLCDPKTWRTRPLLPLAGRYDGALAYGKR